MRQRALTDGAGRWRWALFRAAYLQLTFLGNWSILSFFFLLIEVDSMKWRCGNGVGGGVGGGGEGETPAPRRDGLLRNPSGICSLFDRICF